MRKSLTVQERLDDISKRCGLSEQIVRQVLKASAESSAESTRKGERAMIPYICSLRPIFKRKVTKSGDTKSVLDVRMDPLLGFSNRLEDIVSLKIEDSVEEEAAELNIRCVQLEALM